MNGARVMTDDERTLLLLLAGFADQVAVKVGSHDLIDAARGISQLAFKVEQANAASGRVQRQTALEDSEGRRQKETTQADARGVGACVTGRACPLSAHCHRTASCIVARLCFLGWRVEPPRPQQGWGGGGPMP